MSAPFGSRLPAEKQKEIECDLLAGLSLSQIARDREVSRDQARTIQQRMMRGGPTVSRDEEIEDVKKAIFTLSMQLRYLQGRVKKLEGGEA